MNQKMAQVWNDVLFLSEDDLSSMTDNEYATFENSMMVCTRMHRQRMAEMRSRVLTDSMERAPGIDDDLNPVGGVQP